MSLETTQIETIRSHTLAQIELLTTDPKPTYWIDGQRVHWQEHLDSLKSTVDWCDRKLNKARPFELRSESI